MKSAAAAMAVLLVVWAQAAHAAQEPAEDESLPRPAKGQPAEYYSALAKVHSAFGLFETAEKLQLKALSLATTAAAKERLSFELFEGIYCRAKWWDKAAGEILRTISFVGKDDAAQVRKYRLDRARVLNEAGKERDYLAELQVIAQLSETEEEKQRALHALHSALQKLDKLQPKIDDYEEAVRKNPKDTTTLRLLAEIYCGSGLLNLPGKAIEKYEEIRKTNADDVNACERLARLYAEIAQPEKAVALCERLLKLNPKRFRSYFEDGVALKLAAGKEAEAIAWCEQVAGQHPQEIAVPVAIANLYGGQRKYAEAAAAYEKAIALAERSPEKLALYLRLIEARIGARQYPEAERSCREALKLEIRSEELRKKVRELLNQTLDLQGKPKEE